MKTGATSAASFITSPHPTLTLSGYQKGMKPQRLPPEPVHEGHDDDQDGSAWVVTHAYEGPNRRLRAKWFASKKARLDDAGLPEVAADAESTETLLRRVSLWGGMGQAARDQRARFLATLEALADKGRRGGNPIWPDIVEAAARYVRAVGATGKIDEPLLNDALHAAQAAHVDSECAVPQTEVMERLLSASRAPH